MTQKLAAFLLLSAFVLLFFANTDGAVSGRGEIDNTETSMFKYNEEAAAAVALGFMPFLGILMGVMAPNMETLGMGATSKPVIPPHISIPNSSIVNALEVEIVDKMTDNNAEDHTDAGSASNDNFNITESQTRMSRFKIEESFLRSKQTNQEQ